MGLRNVPGSLWKIEGGKSIAYLAGSLHLLKPTDYPLPDTYEEAWRAAGHLVLESAPEAMSAPQITVELQRLSHLPTGSSLPQILDPEVGGLLQRWAVAHAYPAQNLDILTPWMAGLTVAVVTADRLGFRNDLGMEKHFTRLLPGSGKTCSGLEEPLSALRTLSDLPVETQQTLLRQALLDSLGMARKAGRIREAWKQGNLQELHDQLQSSFAGHPALAKALLEDRNRAWVPAIRQHLEGGKVVMILVGAGHLGGPSGLIQLLKDSGYTLRQVIPAGSREEEDRERPDGESKPTGSG